MQAPPEPQVPEARTTLEQRRKSVLVGPNATALHGGEQIQTTIEGSAEGVALDHGVEEDDVRVVGLSEDTSGVGHLVEGAADGDKVREDLIGLVEAVAEEVGVDLGDLGPGLAAMEESQDGSLRLQIARAYSLHSLVGIDDDVGRESTGSEA